MYHYYATSVPRSLQSSMTAVPTTSTNTTIPINDDDTISRSSSPHNDKDAATGFGWFLFVIFVLVSGSILVWVLWVRYKRRLEQRMQEYRSAQADKVLGDMQMVPNMDLDDNELI